MVAYPSTMAFAKDGQKLQSHRKPLKNVSKLAIGKKWGLRPTTIHWIYIFPLT